jgi:hypothetical protein
MLLSGCVATPPPPPSQQVLSKLDFGKYPDGYEKLIKDHFAKSLFQPESVQYRFAVPYTGYVQEGPLLGGKIQDAGYFVDVWVKAKDRSGGYLPEKHILVLMKNGEVLMELSEQEFGTVKRAP